MSVTITHTTGIIYKSATGGTIANTNESFTGDGEMTYIGTVPSPTTNGEIDWRVLDTAKIRSMVLYSTAAVTIYTNDISSGTPTDTIALAAGQQVTWNPTRTEACPFTAPVTVLYITNASATSADVKLIALMDITPVMVDPA